MPKIREILESGVMGVLPAALAKDPGLLKGFGFAGRAAADYFEEQERAKQAAAQMGLPPQAGVVQPMKKGGEVKARGWGKARGARGAKVY
jgi:hypothetical protein